MSQFCFFICLKAIHRVAFCPISKYSNTIDTFCTVHGRSDAILQCYRFCLAAIFCSIIGRWPTNLVSHNYIRFTTFKNWFYQYNLLDEIVT